MNEKTNTMRIGLVSEDKRQSQTGTGTNDFEASVADTKIRTYLSIVSAEMSGAEIEKAVGLAPAAVWVSGDEIVLRHRSSKQAGLVKRTHKDNGAEFECAPYEGTSISESIQRLLSYIGPVTGRIAGISSKCDVAVICVAYWYEESSPARYLDAQTINRLAALNASFDLDLYELGEE